MSCLLKPMRIYLNLTITLSPSWESASYRSHSLRHFAQWNNQSWSARHLVSTYLNGSCATNGESGWTTRHTSVNSKLTDTWEHCDRSRKWNHSRRWRSHFG